MIECKIVVFELNQKIIGFLYVKIIPGTVSVNVKIDKIK